MDSNQTEAKRGDGGHAPETWIVARTVSGNGYSVHVTDAKYEIIASVGTHDFNVSNPHNPAKGFDSAQIKANAHLISAAPAMKLALDAVAAGVARVEGGEFCFNGLRYSVHDGDWSGSFTAFGLWDKLPAAIAKAKGGVA